MKIKSREDLELFSAIDPFEREQIRKLAIKKMYRKNDYIFKEDDPSNSIYLIKHGRVRVFKSSFEGKEFTLDFFKEKDILGESIFF
jgi:CRP/FNR family transcriptional regulator